VAPATLGAWILDVDGGHVPVCNALPLGLLTLPLASVAASLLCLQGVALRVLAPSASLPPKNRWRDSLTLATFGDFALRSA
jgi:hypothetical protein